jgi:hypothetical protein
MQDWGQVAFSDECYIYLGDSHGRTYVTRQPNKHLKEECLVLTFKRSLVSIMVWGVIMSGQKGPLVILEYPGGKGNGMNLKKYQEQVPEGVFLDFHAQMKAKRGAVIFQQDNAPSHMSKSTKQWFKSHDIPLLYHPPSSPNLNPIEPVWHKLKSHLQRLPHPASILDQLKAAVIHVWDELPIKDVDKHVNTMPACVKAVFTAKGGHTRF